MRSTAFSAPHSGGAGRGRPTTIRVTEHDGVAVVTIRGGIAVRTVPAIRDVLGWAVDHHQRVVVDWSEVAHVDRDGLGLLITMHERAYHREVELRFTAAPAPLVPALRELNAETLLSMLCGRRSAAGPHAPTPAQGALAGSARSSSGDGR